MKEYINHVYQNYAKFSPVQEIIIRRCPRQSINEDGDLQENFAFEKDPITGNIYNTKPNWLGGKTKTLSQGMADYLFENVDVPIYK